MKVKKIGNVILTTPLWWTNYNNVDTIQAQSKETITGDVIVWQQTRGITGLNITLDSLKDGWQDTDTKDLLQTLIALGTTSTITLTDNTVINVRFRYELANGAVSFKRLVDTSLFDYYECKLELARV